MRGLKSKELAVITGFVLLGTTRVLAISELDINNNSLGSYASKYFVVEEIQKYVESKGIKKGDYEKYVKLSRKYRYSKEDKWEALENGTFILDNMLFEVKEIKDEYYKRLKEENDEVRVYESLKKDMLNNPSYVLELIEKVLKDESKMKEVFRAKYERKPTDKELSWFIDEESIKYALYGGELGREITEKEYSLIQQGHGYKLFGLNGDEIEEYAEYILIRDKIVPLERLYYNSIDVFLPIYTRIHNKYKVDIYKCLTEKERLEIHSKSVEGIVFNEDEGYRLIEKKLKSKGIISEVKPGSPSKDDNIKNESIIQDSSSSNPKNELDKNLGANKSIIRETLLSDINKLYTIQKLQYSTDLRNKYICFKYKDKVVNTYIRLYIDGTLDNAGLEKLLNNINEALKSKMIFSSQEALMLIENKIKLLKLEIKDNISFKELVNGFKDVDIELYEEDIIKEDEEKEEKESFDDKVESKYLQIDLDKESYQVPFVEENYIRNIELKNMFEMMGMKYIFTTDSVLILNKNQVFVVKIDAYNKGFVTIEDVKKIFIVIGVKAAIQSVD